jgi:cell filamentation protein
MTGPTDKYDVSGLTEAQFEPESGKTVLKNLRGVRVAAEMDRIEGIELARASDEAFHQFDSVHRFSAHDICELHRQWLGSIYDWAGSYRQVNVSKGGFPFAPAAQLPRLMQQYEKQVLGRYTPANALSGHDLLLALAETHAELLLIHPFREGNGRIARLLATLMALQAGLPLLRFDEIHEARKDEYIAAVQAGLDRNYQPMKAIFERVISQTESVGG